jgi:hypothetical protein
MAELKIIIPDEKVTEVLQVLGESFSYQEQVPDEEGNPISNPMSKAQFVKERIIDFLKMKFREQKADQAVRNPDNELTGLS